MKPSAFLTVASGLSVILALLGGCMSTPAEAPDVTSDAERTEWRNITLDLVITDAGGTPSYESTNCALPTGTKIAKIIRGEVVATWASDSRFAIHTRGEAWDLSSRAGSSPRALNVSGKSIDPTSDDHPIIMLTTEGTDFAARQPATLTIRLVLESGSDLSFEKGWCNRPSPLPTLPPR